MSKEISYKCDSCGKVMNSQFLNNFSVLYYQGEPISSSFNQFSEVFMAQYWKHKNVYHAMICDDCAGTEIDHNYGDNNSGVNFNVMNFLRKIGLIKPLTHNK